MRKRARIISRLDIKAPNLIKGIQLEGLRVIGNPHDFANKYYEQGADELVYMDIVASLYGRNSLTHILERAARDIFVPLTVGGGLRSLEDVTQALRAGADKVAINTAATKNPELISQISQRFGAQCMVLSIEAKERPEKNRWEAFTDNGREHTGLDVIEWAQKGQQMGAGEILLTSVDREGTRKGMDIRLIKAVTSAVTIPVIASGGVGTPEHMIQAIIEGHADAVAIADALHFNRHNMADFKSAARSAGIEVRP